jgi:hypothetical protein
MHNSLNSTKKIPKEQQQLACKLFSPDEHLDPYKQVAHQVKLNIPQRSKSWLLGTNNN